MNRNRSYLFLICAIFLISACTKDDIKKYEGDFSFRIKATKYYNDALASTDTIINSVGTIVEVDKTTLKINYVSQNQADSWSGGCFLLGNVDVKVNNEGYITPAGGNTGYDLTIIGKFIGADSLSMTIEAGTPQLGKITTNVVDGKRI